MTPGYCNIVGRVKDLIIRGGENISPREIEEFLYRHPQDPGRAGLRHPGPALRRSGLRLDQAAKPASRCTAEEIRQFCREQIAHFKVPQHIRFVDEVPDDGHRQDPEIRDAGER